jgi:DNA-binding transcriptional LysR family regulator
MGSMNLLEALRYLAALDQHRHFGRAAQACHITQPALSNALRALESELGVALVRRSRQYEGLTTEGQVAVAHAHRLLHGTEALRQELAGLDSAPRGTLQIGSVPTALPVAARFAARLRARHPGLRPVLRSLSSQDIEAGLESLALDLGLGFIERSEVAARRLAVLPQYRERYFLVRHRAGEAPGPGPQGLQGLHFGLDLPWADAARDALVMLTPEMHNRAVVERALREAGARFEPAMETNSVLALLLAVRAPGGLTAVLPGALVATVRDQPGLQAQALIDPLVETPVGWMTASAVPASRTLGAALALARDADWLADLALHTGGLVSG